MAGKVELAWFDDLDAVAADAGGALDRAAQPQLFDRLDWFRLTVAHRLAGPPLVLRARDRDGAAWLFTTPAGAPLASWYTLRFGVVRHGTRKEVPNSVRPEPFDSPPGRALGTGCHPPDGSRRPRETLSALRLRSVRTEDEVADPLLSVLFREAGRRLPRLSLHPLADDPARAVERALRRAGWWTFATPVSASWTVDGLDGDFARFWAARPAALRNTVARRSRSHPLDIAILDRFDAAAWDAYEAVYRASWKPDEGSFPFLRALAEREGAAGTLRLGIARDPEARAVAAQLWLVEDGVAAIHKLAHREDARAGSPGSLLSHAMFSRAIATDRVRRIDFGLGDEPYKRDWVDTRQPVWRIDAFRPGTVRGLAGIAREAAARLARRRAKP